MHDINQNLGEENTLNLIQILKLIDDARTVGSHVISSNYIKKLIELA